MKAYVANGLFSLADRLVNERCAALIRERVPGIDLYVPQENPDINDKTKCATSEQIAAADLHALDEADVLVAWLDGVEIDAGVAAEIGYFASKNRPIIGIFTDVRQQGTDQPEKIARLTSDPTENQFVYRNLFVVGLIKRNGRIVQTIEDAAEAVARVAKGERIDA